METKTSPQIISDRCKDSTAAMLGDGAFLTQTVATQLIANYLNGINDPNGTGHDFGYLFGLDNIMSLVARINTYNNGLPATEQIQGLRMYLARTAAISPGSTMSMERIMDNLILMPVLAGGIDLYKVAPLVDPNMILGNPRPCPNECLAFSFLSV